MKGFLILMVIILVVLLSGCTSPISDVFRDLNESYIGNTTPVHYNHSIEGEFSSDIPSPGPNQAASRFEIEFLSQEEWNRRAVAGTLTREAVVSKSSIGPVKLSLSTLEQPIRAGTGFFIGIELKSVEEGKEIAPPVEVEVDIPTEFVTEEGDVPCYGLAEIKSGKIIWEIKEGWSFKDSSIYCDFYPDAEEIIPAGSPSRTYLITASAEYGLEES